MSAAAPDIRAQGHGSGAHTDTILRSEHLYGRIFAVSGPPCDLPGATPIRLWRWGVSSHNR
jgi:hypothetical protein